MKQQYEEIVCDVCGKKEIWNLTNPKYGGISKFTNWINVNAPSGQLCSNKTEFHICSINCLTKLSTIQDNNQSETKSDVSSKELFDALYKHSKSNLMTEEQFYELTDINNKDIWGVSESIKEVHQNPWNYVDISSPCTSQNKYIQNTWKYFWKLEDLIDKIYNIFMFIPYPKNIEKGKIYKQLYYDINNAIQYSKNINVNEFKEDVNACKILVEKCISLLRDNIELLDNKLIEKFCKVENEFYKLHGWNISRISDDEISKYRKSQLWIINKK